MRHTDTTSPEGKGRTRHRHRFRLAGSGWSGSVGTSPGTASIIFCPGKTAAEKSPNGPSTPMLMKGSTSYGNIPLPSMTAFRMMSPGKGRTFWLLTHPAAIPVFPGRRCCFTSIRMDVFPVSRKASSLQMRDNPGHANRVLKRFCPPQVLPPGELLACPECHAPLWRNYGKGR